MNQIIVFVGSAIMLLNIILYIRFERRFRKEWGWKSQKLGLYFPIFLLILFLIGYVIVGFTGRADPIVAGILIGGSIFVLAVLELLQSLANQVRETEELRINLQAAERASVSKSTFLSNMSHDIRTPLNAIIGYTRLASDDNASETDVKSYLSKISTSGNQLLELINDILEMSRIENGKVHLAEEPNDLVQIVEDVHIVFDDQMREKKLTFVTDTSAVQDRYVICDKVRVSRILLNLISNAYKFTPEGGSVNVSLSQEEGTDNYRISVRDTGIGMTEEFAEHVFESFERERSSTISGIQGTGLGMAITKNLVTLMGGTIDVHTKVGEGTEFTIDLSFRNAQAEITADDSDAAKHDAGCACNRRILLAEDIEINREIATHLLESMGACVEQADNGQDAVDMVATAPPGYYDVVLMDIQMPVMDGYEATRQIRALPDPEQADIPIVALTANAFAEDRSRALEAGMNGHVSKPLDPPALKQELMRIMK